MKNLRFPLRDVNELMTIGNLLNTVLVHSDKKSIQEKVNAMSLQRVISSINIKLQNMPDRFVLVLKPNEAALFWLVLNPVLEHVEYRGVHVIVRPILNTIYKELISKLV